MMPRPCSAAEAVQRAQALLLDPSNATHGYQLGSGGDGDLPWTTAPNGVSGSDCAGFAISWCYQLPRHRLGFNVGAWSTVADDINVDSAIQDAEHDGDLFASVTDGAQPGDLLVYPTITLPEHPGMRWIGHVCIVEMVPDAWSLADGWTPLTVIQCKGPNGRMPAVQRTDGGIWTRHDAMWPKDEHRSRLLRVVP